MSLKDSLVNKLETQTEYWNKRIDSLRADANEKLAKAKDDHAQKKIENELSENIRDLEKKVDEARSKLGEIRDAGEDKLKDLKKRVEKWLE